MFVKPGKVGKFMKWKANNKGIEMEKYSVCVCIIGNHLLISLII